MRMDDIRAWLCAVCGVYTTGIHIPCMHILAASTKLNTKYMTVQVAALRRVQPYRSLVTPQLTAGTTVVER